MGVATVGLGCDTPEPQWPRCGPHLGAAHAALLACCAGGIDVVHGHSSHHAKGAEVYKGKLIIYGAGDLLSDYEGITVRAGSVRTHCSPGSVQGRPRSAAPPGAYPDK